MAFPIKIKSGRKITALSDSSVSVEDKNGVQEYLFSDVIGLKSSFDPNFVWLVTVGGTYDISIWFRGEDAPLVIKGKYKKSEDCAVLDSMIESCVKSGTDNSIVALENGETLEGDSWKLSRSGFTTMVRGEMTEFSFDRIDHFGYFDEFISFWVDNNEKPTLWIEPVEKNVPILCAILKEYLESKTSDDAPTAPTADQSSAMPSTSHDPSDGKVSQHGRQLFETKLWVRPMLIGAGIVVGLIGLAGLVAGLTDDPNAGANPYDAGFDVTTVSLMIGAIVVGMVLAAAGFFAKNPGISCYEKAVKNTSIFGQPKIIPYEDITSFVFNETVTMVGGKPSTSDIKISFTGTSDTAKIRLPNNEFPDKKMDFLMQHVSNVLSEKFVERIQTGGEVEFGNASLTQSGMVVAGKTIPYDDIEKIESNEGVVRIFEKGQKKPVLKLKSKVPNFFPGYQALEMLMEQ